MIKIKNFDRWEIYKGAEEGAGRSEKDWLENENSKEIGLFKYPKETSENIINSTEYVSEHLASKIAEQMKIKSTKIDIGTRNSRIGSMSYKMNEKDEILIHGVDFISAIYKSFDPEKLYDRETKEYYSYDMIFNALFKILFAAPLEVKNGEDKKTSILIIFCHLAIFDYVIGNTDRHQNNWSFILRGLKPKGEPILEFAPLYDNGSSLCAYINDNDIEKYMGKDKQRFKSLVDTKSRSRIRIDSKKKKEPTHKEVIEYLYSKYRNIMEPLLRNTCSEIDNKWIARLIKEYPDKILSKNKKKLINKYICKKIDMIKEMINR